MYVTMLNDTFALMLGFKSASDEVEYYFQHQRTV